MKFILGALGIIFVVILAVVLIFRGGGNDRDIVGPRLDVSKEAREGVSAVFTTQGEVVGEDQRKAIRIIVNQDERRLEVLTGYEEAVERSSTFANTHAAFETFLVSIDQAGFENRKPSAVEDERGACPLGKRYIYELREHSQELLRLWNTSCGSKQGTFDGNSSTIRQLFEQQIPDYDKAVSNVDLNG
jgi:hypothetical protein